MTDEQARQVEENIGLVKFLIRKHFPRKTPVGDFEDLVQIGCIGLCKAVETFKPERRRAFSTYASKCILNELRMAIRHCKAGSRTAETPDTSLQTPVGEDRMTLEDVIADPNAGTEHLLEARARLLDVARYFRGEPVLLRAAANMITQQEAGSILGISQAEVSRRIKERLNAYYEEDHHGKD